MIQIKLVPLIRPQYLKELQLFRQVGLVNIFFAAMVYFIVVFSTTGELGNTANMTVKFLGSIIESVKLLVTGQVGINDFMGPVGISTVVAHTDGLKQFFYIMAVVSLSLGFTNLLPVPPLDGGKIVFLVIEAIRKKPLGEYYENSIQMIGFGLMIALSLYVTYNDVLRAWGV